MYNYYIMIIKGAWKRMYSVVFLSKYLFTKYLKKMSYREVCFSEMEQTFNALEVQCAALQA